MGINKAIVVVLLCGISVPAAAQDFLAPLQDMVDELTAPAAPSGPAPEAEPAGAPPVPRPRPPSLPDVPEVAPPEPPKPPIDAPEPVEDTAPEPQPIAEAPPEPKRVYQVACPAVIQGLVEAEMAPPLSEGACGEQSPLIVTGVLSRGRMVPLSAPVTTNCQMASALPEWVEDVDGYAEAMLESPLAGVTTGTSYMCRPRNSGDAQFTSEHGFANALDVVGFTLEDGRSIGITENWLPADGPDGRLLRLAHDSACGSFMTVLGPEANAEHSDHLHLDMGCHGERCQQRICE
jgi:hypothetical protein